MAVRFRFVERSTWVALGFSMADPHAYHYAVEWSESADSCRFTVQAFGDLDGDGVYSTFTRAWRDDGEAAKLVTENELD